MIVDMLSNVNLGKDLQMLALGGRVVVSKTFFLRTCFDHCLALWISLIVFLSFRFFEVPH